ncbi:GNAT family N-acetyltransferase [Candidatus Bipolaricaulota bacterium]|nr:GNAT family N-acetyltransferase [Candidatus Bipolaricaulota bacterium]
MRIRELTISDYDAIVRLWEESGLPYRPEGRDRRDRIAHEIDGSCSVFLGAEEDGTLVGAVLGTHDGRKGWINRLVVAPTHRKRGIGAALVAEVERRLAELGIEIVTCLIETWNTGSMSFFEGLGFVEHGECVYYSKRKNPNV